jgi:hypothetical protein
MRPNLFHKTRIVSIGLIFLFQGPVFGADRPAPSDKTIVLEESQIKGAGSVANETRNASLNEALPTLSTPLPWEGEEPGEAPNIAREVFRQLAQPNPSYFTEDPTEQSEPTKRR